MQQEMSLAGKTIQLQRLSFSNLGGVASTVNRSFSRDPSTVFVFDYPAPNLPTHAATLSATEPMRRAMLLRQLCNPRLYVFAALVEDDVAGFSFWAPPENLQRPMSSALRICDLLLQAYDQLVALLYPEVLQKYFNFARVDRRRRHDLIISEISAAENRIVPQEIKERDYWELTVLGVSEEYRRHGIGSALLKWGMAKADEADKAIIIAGSDNGEKLYVSHGFQVLERVTLLEQETTKGVPLTYMIRWPRSRREKAADFG